MTAPFPMTDALQTILLTAVENAREGITVSDARLPDNPLIYANKGFLEMTGYSMDEVLHKNCRFLQGTERDQPARHQLRTAILERKPVQVEMVNFRKDGLRFFNRLSITPVFDNAGTLTHFIGIQEDVTALRQKEAAAQGLVSEHLQQAAAVQAREEERKRLGQELHDNINQLLATAQLLLNTETLDAAEQKERMRNSSALVNQAIEEIRQLSRHLVEPRLESLNLHGEVNRLVATLQPALPFAVHPHFSLDETRLSNAQKLLLYRVVQEGMTNCLKHAHPANLWIVLREVGGDAELVVEDDGAGFVPGSAAAGIGLRNLQSRVEKERGRIEIWSRPGAGCRLCVTLPFCRE